jgi:hypothetical protein
MDKELNSKILKRLDSITLLLENLFILEASKAKINKQEIRKILGIAMERVNQISKFIKDDRS